jgi:hypothetical protein
LWSDSSKTVLLAGPGSGWGLIPDWYTKEFDANSLPVSIYLVGTSSTGAGTVDVRCDLTDVGTYATTYSYSLLTCTIP